MDRAGNLLHLKPVLTRCAALTIASLAFAASAFAAPNAPKNLASSPTSPGKSRCRPSAAPPSRHHRGRLPQLQLQRYAGGRRHRGMFGSSGFVIAVSADQSTTFTATANDGTPPGRAASRSPTSRTRPRLPRRPGSGCCRASSPTSTSRSSSAPPRPARQSGCTRPRTAPAPWPRSTRRRLLGRPAGQRRRQLDDHVLRDRHRRGRQHVALLVGHHLHRGRHPAVQAGVAVGHAGLARQQQLARDRGTVERAPRSSSTRPPTAPAPSPRPAPPPRSPRRA